LIFHYQEWTMNVERFDCDVLVIGGGGAGAMAAIWAAKEAKQVALVEKGVFGKAGCTVMGAFSMCAAFGYADPADDPRRHFEDTIRGGRFINRQDLVELYTREAPDRVMELVSYGAHFDLENGRLHQAMMEGHSLPRACHYDRRTGPMIMGTLARQVRKTPAVRVFEEVVIIDIEMNPAGFHYAIGVRWADTKFIVFQAKAIVVTTGGGAQIYKNNTTSLDNTGDGISLMFEVGVELADMEFVQFYPTTVCSPKLPGLGPTATAFLRLRTGARLYNARGENFMDQEMPGWRFQATRDRLSQAIYKEIAEGRGTPNGGVYLDITHLPLETIRKEYAIGNYYKKLLSIGVDISQRPIETKVSAHFFMGGARVNERGETNIPGLFAGGEAVSGYHGANRLGGNALSEILVSGSRAGQYAAIWAGSHRSQGERQWLNGRLNAWEQKIREWQERKSGLRPIVGKRKIQELMWEFAGVVREGAKIEKGLGLLTNLKDEAKSHLSVTPGKHFNREILDAFELTHMIRISTLILRAASARRESRGAHYRLDFPFPDNKEWLANIVLQRAREDISLRIEKVRLTHIVPED
jgi:fumarate reductase (CoM/CoB) subunit A